MNRFGPPPVLTPLLGRAVEQERLSALMRLDTPLVTLTGPPGIGKTRLAVEAFRQWRGAPAVWIDVSTIASAGELYACVADALGIRLSWIDVGDFVSELGYAIESRGPVLIVLDQAEGAIEALSAVIPRWLAAAPEARVLITSRERIGSAGETLIEVGPLSTEPQGVGCESPALQLVLQQAGIALPPRTADRDALERLVAALDGIPLALELVAARLRVLSPEEILERFASRGLSAIEARRGGPSPLHTALQESWLRLDEAEQVALARCAVFVGSFDTAASEALLGEEAIDLLQRLRDQSLLARQGRRHRLYAPVRAFAAACLDELGLRASTQENHAQHYAAIARQHLRALLGSDQITALQSLIDELDELRAAWTAARGQDQRDLALAIAEVLVERGPAESALQQLDAMPLDPKILLARAKVHEVMGRIDDAVAGFEQAAEALSTPADRTLCLARLAGCELSRGAVESAVAWADRALELAPPRDPARVEALRQRAIVSHARGELEAAAAHYEHARRLADELSLTHRAAQLRADLGSVLLQERRLDEARDHYCAAVELLDPDVSPIALGLAEGNLAILEQELGELSRAAELHARGMARLRAVGHRLYVAHLAGYAGAVEHERGALEAALVLYEQALDGLRRVGDTRLIAVVAALRGAAEAERGRLSAAVAAFGEADDALDRIEDPGVHRAVELHRMHLEVTKDAAVGRPRALAALSAAASDELVARSDDARIAMRLLDRRLGRGRITLSLQEARITRPDGQEIDLSTRAVLWRIVLALGRAHTEGRALDVHDLLDAGWPGESVGAESGSNRVKVALSTLRKLGLSELLVRGADGYSFDVAIPLVIRERPRAHE